MFILNKVWKNSEKKYKNFEKLFCYQFVTFQKSCFYQSNVEGKKLFNYKFEINKRWWIIKSSVFKVIEAKKSCYKWSTICAKFQFCNETLSFKPTDTKTVK